METLEFEVCDTVGKRKEICLWENKNLRKNERVAESTGIVLSVKHSKCG